MRDAAPGGALLSILSMAVMVEEPGESCFPICFGESDPVASPRHIWTEGLEARELDRLGFGECLPSKRRLAQEPNNRGRGRRTDGFIRWGSPSPVLRERPLEV